MKKIGMCMFCGDQGKTEIVDGVHELCADCADMVRDEALGILESFEVAMKGSF